MVTFLLSTRYAGDCRLTAPKCEDAPETISLAYEQLGTSAPGAP